MIAKWIVCTIPDHKRALFSTAQEVWTSIALLDGFVAQAGGWDRNNPKRACVLGVWQDWPSYNSFMNHHHDEIVNRSSQNETTSQCDIRVFDRAFGQPGAGNDFVESLKTATVLQVTRYQGPVTKGAVKNGTQIGDLQRDMRARERGGSHSHIPGEMLFQGGDDPLQYLAVAGWPDLQSRDPQAQSANAVDHTPLPLTVMNGDRRITKLDTTVLKLEPRWLVVAR